VGRNVKILMPPQIAKHHNKYIREYLKTSRSKFIGKPRIVPVLLRNGTQEQMQLCVGEYFTRNTRRFFATLCAEVSLLPGDMLPSPGSSTPNSDASSSTIYPSGKTEDDVTGSEWSDEDDEELEFSLAIETTTAVSSTTTSSTSTTTSSWVSSTSSSASSSSTTTTSELSSSPSSKPTSASIPSIPASSHHVSSWSSAVAPSSPATSSRWNSRSNSTLVLPSGSSAAGTPRSMNSDSTEPKDNNTASSSGWQARRPARSDSVGFLTRKSVPVLQPPSS